MESKVMSLNSATSYKYVIILARHKGQWVLCQHKDRETWETAGGHIEVGETPNEAAKRELYEETGALDFHIEPIFDFWSNRNGIDAYAMIFYADIYSFGELPDSEMEKIQLFDELPEQLTYPVILRELFLNYIEGEMRQKK